MQGQPGFPGGVREPPETETGVGVIAKDDGPFKRSGSAANVS